MALARELQMAVPTFQNRILMQFEVDYRLFMRIFLWDGHAPHYQLDPHAPFVDVVDALRQRAGGAAPATASPPQPSSPRAGAVKAGYDLSVDVIQAQANSRPATSLIAAEQELSETFHYNGDVSCRGVIAALPDLFDEGGKLAVHVRRAGESEWVLAGELQRPVGPRPSLAGLERVTEYPRRYRLTLDERGVVRVHLGEVPYWKTEDLDDWKTRPGRVLQRDLELVEPPPRENRDPFCGAH
jgi:hypothetical protein